MRDSSLELENKAKPLAQIISQMSLLVFFAGLALGLSIITGISFNQRDQVALEVGDRASQTIIAPRSINYVSDMLTLAEREQVVSGIYIYTTLDRGVGRQQGNQAREVFRYVEVVRSDSLASDITKLDYLQSIESLDISAETASLMLGLSQEEFIAARNETLDQISSVMLQTIRPEQLANAKRDARSQISFDLNQDQEQIVQVMAPQFIVPNVFLDEEATRLAQEEAANGVEPVQQVYTQGQSVVRVGEIVQAEDIEALERLGLLQQDQTDWFRIASAVLVSTLCALILMIYWWRFMNEEIFTPRYLILLLFLILVFTAVARVTIFYDLIYLFPAAGLAMLLSMVIQPRLSVMVMFVVAMLAGYMSGRTLEPVLYTGISSIIAVMTLRDPHRFASYFRAGTLSIIGNLAIILIFNLGPILEAGDLSIDLLMGLINGLLLSPFVTIAGFFLVGLFGVITVVQLQDLSRLDHPLLQELLRKAPGTYHHSIMVANLAEQAAERIEANGTLVRVGAFYHDIGKMDRPQFFSENQAGGNPHDSISPYMSAEIILSHVTSGLEKAKKARLPVQIQSFIAEHHGRGVVRFFYERAKQLAGEDNEDEVDIDLFRYQGPRPRSRETGIVLLADTVEAASSAIQPETEQEIEKLVNKFVDDHMKAGQLNRSGLTMGDLEEIRESFIETLKGRFHIRVKYPGNNELKDGDAQEEPEAAVLDVPLQPTPLLAPNQDVAVPTNGNSANKQEEQPLESVPGRSEP